MGKLLVLDLDGTTVNHAGKLGCMSAEALASARKQGHLVCFATGRRDIDMFSSWYLVKHADYLLLNNGGKLIRTSDMTVLFRTCIPAETARELISTCLRKNWQLHVISGDYWALNKWNDGLQSYVDFLGTSPDRYDCLEETPWREVEGFMATADWKPVCQYIDQARLPLAYTLSEDNCVDIMAEGISKWDGVCHLMTLLHILPEDVIAVGDYYNDLPMIRGAGIGVAVANALKEVKAEADYVTKQDCDHDAVAEVVEQFLL